MKRTWIAALLALSTSVAHAQQKIDIHKATTPTVSVRLGGALSSVTIVGWDRDSVSIVGGLGAGSRIDGGAMKSAGPVQGMKFFVEASDEPGIRANRVELRVPRNARVWIKAGSADIDCGGVEGGLDLNIVGGSVRVNGKPRELLVESMDGTVTVTGGATYARLKTATGDIVIQGSADDLTATTVSGAIRASNGTLERARFESVTGAINFASDFARGGDLRFDTHSGNIELAVSRRGNVDLDIATMTGSIDNRWNSVRPIAGREGRGMELGTSSGFSGARITARSFKGSVVLTAR